MPRRPPPSPPAPPIPSKNLRNLRNLRTNLARYRWHIRGQVQGVGFRPFLFRIATAAGLTGRVLNNPAGVLLEIQGTPAAIAAFTQNFHTQLPPLARIDSCQKTKIKPLPRENKFIIDLTEEPLSAFRIPHSAFSPVTPDTALCPDCLREMLAPDDRRYLHPLINCTNCGPRFSIIKNVPYDRKNTTMAPFKMCPACAKEYKNPADRRFHAQPVCCPRCGPQISLIYTHNSGRKPGAGNRLPKRTRRAGENGGGAILAAAQLLLAGKIVAIKGLGGFHLAVRADRASSVDRLRKLKKRDAKPFAIMVPDLPAALALANISPPAQAELTSPRAPIVLSPRNASDSASSPNLTRLYPLLANSVAPGTDLIGLLLPYTPLHHLLIHALFALQSSSKRPAGSSSFTVSPCHLVTLSPVPPLVMTSGNLSSEPLVIDNDDAIARLGPMCDAILLHDRPIERCVDDSVILDRGPDRPPLPIRRSRGYVPSAFQVDTSPKDNVSSAPTHHSSLITHHSSGLCLGGELKNTVAVVRNSGSGGGGEIILSQHLGDLSDARSFDHFQKAIEDLIRLFHIDVQFIAHDLHPTYMSTQYAKALSARFHAPLVPIQHHAAHAFAVMGEHRLNDALAIVCDGTGYGTDGTIWGGELLAVHGARWQRLGCLKPMRLPGGDAAARDPRRSAMALLHAAFGTGFEKLPHAKKLFPQKSDRSMIAHMITNGISSPWTSSTGRLFDAIAALLGICLTNDHEAQAAMALEAAAHSSPETLPPEPLFQLHQTPDLLELDLSPFVHHLIHQTRTPNHSNSIAQLAQLFHRELARGFVALAQRAAEKDPSCGMNLVASGGSLCNRILESEMAKFGVEAGFRTFFHELYPPTDAGLAHGQAIFARRLALTGDT